jgi:hypothetical protein
MTEEVEPTTLNMFIVGVGNDTVNILRPAHALTREEAINLAVYLVTCASALKPYDRDPKDEFDALYKRVMST